MKLHNETKMTECLQMELLPYLGGKGSFELSARTACMPDHSAADGCTKTYFSALVQLTPCRPAIKPYSPIKPSDACCYAVKTLGHSCFCLLMDGPPVTGVDRNLAMMLPAKCSSNFKPCKGDNKI